MPSTVFLESLAVSFGAHRVFAGLDLTVGPRHVVALVGPNGSGKTSLLRTISAELPPEAGEVRLSPPSSLVGYLPQEIPQDEESILAFVGRRTGTTTATHEFETAAQDLAEHETAQAADRYDAAFERWMHLGAADVEARTRELVDRVGLGVDVDRPLGTLSGGQAARAALLSILASRFDVLLLDEPTNNLDADGIALVTQFVTSFAGPVLVASHDRSFLDAVADHTVELDIHQHTVHHFTGGWSSSREQKDLVRIQAVEARKTYDQRRDDLEARARRQNDWAAKARGNAAHLGNHMQLARQHAENQAAKLDQRAARARAAADRMEEAPELRKEWKLHYQLPQAAASADVVCSIDGVLASHGNFKVGPLTTTINRGDRIALVGPNGAGKTTMLQCLLDANPVEGRISWGTRTKIGRLDQNRDLVRHDEILLEAIEHRLCLTPVEARTLLAKFGLGNQHITRPWASLSMGERTRAILAMWQHQPTNVLVLDEPTNHLDVEAIEQLQTAITTYSGTVLLVTHDQVLLDALAPTRSWHFALTAPERASLTVHDRDRACR